MKNDALLLAAVLALPPSALAQWSGWDYEFDQEKKPWSEIEVRIPPYPQPQNLVEFEAGAASPHRFYVDPGSISVGGDGVVRYILVIKTAGGASNVTFEGMRCATRQQKYYATGRSDGSWARARNPAWNHIEHKEINRHHIVLYADFFCNGKLQLSAEEVLARVKGSAVSFR
ncbi:MAG: CNP1-like family protein [Burkholderiales bacterium]